MTLDRGLTFLIFAAALGAYWVIKGDGLGFRRSLVPYMMIAIGLSLGAFAIPWPHRSEMFNEYGVLGSGIFTLAYAMKLLRYGDREWSFAFFPYGIAFLCAAALGALHMTTAAISVIVAGGAASIVALLIAFFFVREPEQPI